MRIVLGLFLAAVAVAGCGGPGGGGTARKDPGGAVAAMTAAVPGLDPDALGTQLRAAAPAFSGRGGLDPPTLRAWAGWDVRFGILEHRPDVARAFDTSVAAG